jgi:serine/threonine-protein kinase
MPGTGTPLGEGAYFAGFVVVRLLGSGGMGQVYLVRHPRLPRHEALKVLPAQIAATDDDFRTRFIREADLAAGLFHPHIVGVHDRGEHEGQLWISMDYVEGTDLAQLMRQRYPAGMPAGEVVTIITAVADALDYAHHQGLLHRDVKPANILIGHPDERGVPRILLTDFGIARPLHDVSGLTVTNTTLGTVAYAAPEQLLGHHTDARADQYALAATAFYLLTGTRTWPLWTQCSPPPWPKTPSTATPAAAPSPTPSPGTAHNSAARRPTRPKVPHRRFFPPRHCWQPRAAAPTCRRCRAAEGA